MKKKHRMNVTLELSRNDDGTCSWCVWYGIGKGCSNLLDEGNEKTWQAANKVLKRYESFFSHEVKIVWDEVL